MARTVRFERRLPAPEAATAQLKQQTRFSLTPFQGSFITLGGAPLKGRVSARGFTVGLNERDWLTLLQPTARGTIRTGDGGAVVDVTVSLPPLMLWYLRIVVGLLIPLLLVAGGTAVFVGSMPLSAAAGVFGVAALMLAMIVVGVGINMNNVDKQVDALAAQVEAVLGAPPPQPEADPTREPQQKAHRARQAQRTGG